MRSAVLAVVVSVLVATPLVGQAQAKKAKPQAGVDEIQAAVRAVLPAARKCFTEELKNNANLEGVLTIEMKIGKDAALKESKVAKDELGSAPVAACIMGALKEAKFPPSAAGKTVMYPFRFAPTRTIAVLPFDNMTGDKSLDWLKSGAAESLLTKLGQVPSLVLVDRMKLDAVLAEQALGQSGAVDEKSAIAAGKIAGAQRVIVGAFQRAGKKTRLTARVLEVETGKVRETASADGRIDDIFALQDALAAKVAETLNLPPSPERDAALALRISSSRPLLEILGRANNALHGTGEPRDPAKAEALFRQVVAADPRIPEAYLGVARALWRVKKTDAQVREIQTLLEKAIALRPDYYEVISMLGFHLFLTGSPDEAFAQQKKALALKPDFALGHYGLALGYAAAGKVDEALGLMRTAISLDPRDAEFLTQYAQLLAAFKRDYRTAMDLARKAIAMDGAVEWNFLTLAYVELMSGDATGCLATLDKGRKRRSAGDRPEHAGQSMMLEAACLTKAGNTAEARAAYARIKDNPQFIAMKDQKLPPGFPVYIKILGSDVIKELAPVIQEAQPPAPAPAK